MVVFMSIKTLIRNPNGYWQAFLTFSPSAAPHPSQSPPLSHPSVFPFSPSRSGFLSPLSHGPLFLSSPPSMLWQSATPLYLQCDAVLLQKVEALSLASMPIMLGLETASSVLFNGVDRKDEDGNGCSSASGNGFGANFVNSPNMISMSGLASGPVIAWMIVNGWYLPAFVGLAVSGASDWLDGYMPRKMRINSF